MSTLFLEIGNRLRDVRSSTGLSQAEFAELIGTSYRSYRAYETGKREITSALVLRVEKVPNVPRGWLLSGKKPELSEDQFTIIEETVELGLKEILSKTHPVDVNEWARNFRLAIKLGLGQERCLSANDVAQLVGQKDGNQTRKG